MRERKLYHKNNIISSDTPLYVCAIDPQKNQVVLGKENETYTQTFTVKDINMISVPFFDKTERLKVKVRYRHTEQWANVTQIDSDILEITFDVPQRAITKGQAAVLYDGDIVVGSGTIQ